MKFLFQGKVDILVLTKPKLDNSFPTNQFMIEGYLKPFRLKGIEMEKDYLKYSVKN